MKAYTNGHWHNIYTIQRYDTVWITMQTKIDSFICIYITHLPHRLMRILFVHFILRVFSLDIAEKRHTNHIVATTYTIRILQTLRESENKQTNKLIQRKIKKIDERMRKSDNMVQRVKSCSCKKDKDENGKSHTVYRINTCYAIFPPPLATTIVLLSKS